MIQSKREMRIDSNINSKNNIDKLKEIESRLCDGDTFHRDGKLHRRQIVAFSSRSLKSHEKRYGITKLEGLAVAWALRSFHLYIAHTTTEVNVFTDHRALETMFIPGNDLLNGTLANWSDILT